MKALSGDFEFFSFYFCCSVCLKSKLFVQLMEHFGSRRYSLCLWLSKKEDVFDDNLVGCVTWSLSVLFFFFNVFSSSVFFFLLLNNAFWSDLKKGLVCSNRIQVTEVYTYTWKEQRKVFYNANDTFFFFPTRKIFYCLLNFQKKRLFKIITIIITIFH